MSCAHGRVSSPRTADLGHGQLRGQRLVVQRGPKHAHSMPNYAIRRRSSISLISHANTNNPAASPATLPISNSTDLVCTMPTVSGRLPVSRPAQSTQIRTFVPAGTPVLVGTIPSLIAPHASLHRPATQNLPPPPHPET